MIKKLNIFLPECTEQESEIRRVQEKEMLIVRALVEGDQDAFLQIFEQYHRGLYVHILRFVKSPDVAADLVQDVFVKVWENRAQIKVECSFRGYLYRIAKNHLINFLKRATKEKHIKQEILKYSDSFHNQNEEQVILSDFELFADRAIASLPPQRQVVFKLFKAGNDYHEIAAQMGISKHTVRDHLAKATKFIKQFLRAKTGISFFIAIATWFSR